MVLLSELLMVMFLLRTVMTDAIFRLSRFTIARKNSGAKIGRLIEEGTCSYGRARRSTALAATRLAFCVAMATARVLVRSADRHESRRNRADRRSVPGRHSGAR